MKRFIFSLLFGLLVVGCSDGEGDTDAGPPDGGLKPYGYSCEADADCESKECLEYVANRAKAIKKKVCTKPCTGLSDCGSVFGKPLDCAEVESKKLRCIPRNYKTTQYEQGHNCSADGKCVSSYICTGLSGDADRYCASKCEQDTDCPPRYRCATTRSGKDLDKEKRCLLRQFCHPCAFDDQCGGPDDLCVRDKNGNRFCGKACTKTGSTCPGYAKCVDAGNSKLQCQHKAGFCFKSFKKEGERCDPCIVHGWNKKNNGGNSFTWPTTIAEEGACKDSLFCQLLDRYTGDAGCIEPCIGTDKCAATEDLCWDSISNASIGLAEDDFFFPIFGKRMCAPKDSSGALVGCFHDPTATP
jgi:hypothetical protein